MVTSTQFAVGRRSLLIACASSFFLIHLSGCSTAGGPQNKAEFRLLADEIARQINRCRAVEEEVVANDLEYSPFTATYTFSFSGAAVGNNGVLGCTRLRVNSKHGRNGNTFSSAYQVALPKVERIWIRSNSLGLQVTGSGAYGAFTKMKKIARMQTKIAFHVHVFTEIDGVTEHATNSYEGGGVSTTKHRTSAADIAVFQTREAAVQFANELQRLVSMLRRGQEVRVSIN
ncbi:MAG: hypothetical protein HS117_22405 [Verrucomicrobiaceae bacterium]|nr:hypothetical protein [Verrucomicrobiaceae bacterium]